MGPPGKSRPLVRLALFLGVFVALTGLGIWWAAPAGETLAAIGRGLQSLSTATYLGLAALALGLIAAEMLRLVVMGRALGAPVGFWAALDATIANNFFSWITPGAALGEPAATYMLGRRGVPWDAAVLIAFGKFAISFAVIFGLGFALVALGMGPSIPRWVMLPIAVAVGAFAMLLSILIVGAFWPGRTTALIDRLERRLGHGRIRAAIAATARDAVSRLGRFRQAGLLIWMAILASQVLYHGIFVGVLIVLAAGFGAEPLVDLVPTAIIYQAFLYLAPTPGSSGLGEASANLFFGDHLGAGGAFALVISFRALTYYLHVALGLIYLPLAGGLRAILSARDQPSRSAASRSETSHASDHASM